MNCDYYSVMYEGIVLAQHMTLGTALILLEALFQKFYSETNIGYTIKREEPPQPCKCNDEEDNI